MKLNQALTYLFRISALGLCLFATTWVLADDDDDHGERSYYGESRSGQKHLPEITHAKFKEECGSCHTLYHPGLLPARSWQKLMGGLDKHFGEDASLDPALQRELTTLLVNNAADNSNARKAQKIARSIPANQTPLRFTETRYFVHEHDEIGTNVWKREKVGSKSNCGACHPNAERGNFRESEIRIPR